VITEYDEAVEYYLDEGYDLDTAEELAKAQIDG
jgi:hypothetical protein